MLWPRQILRLVKVRAMWWGKQPCSFESFQNYSNINQINGVHIPRYWVHESALSRSTVSLRTTLSGGAGGTTPPYACPHQISGARGYCDKSRQTSCWPHQGQGIVGRTSVWKWHSTMTFKIYFAITGFLPWKLILIKYYVATSCIAFIQ